MLTSHTCTNQTNLMKGFVSGDATIRAPAAASSDFVLKARVSFLVSFCFVLFFFFLSAFLTAALHFALCYGGADSAV